MTSPQHRTTIDDDLIWLARTLSEPARGLAILAEGNVSGRTGEGRMLVKATGSSMAAAGTDDLVELELAPLLSLLDDGGADDASVNRVLRESRLDASAKQPSIEALLHAVALTLGGAEVVAHTHPLSVNSILCSTRADALVGGALFPDQVVVLRRHQLLVEYVDPGLDLGRAVRDRLRTFIDRNGYPPKAIYLANHGLFALGGSAHEVMQITAMADKAARILGGALAVGEPVFLTAENADRIDRRPDELLRRQVLSAAATE